MSDAERLAKIEEYKDMITRALIFGGDVTFTKSAAEDIWNILDEFAIRLRTVLRNNPN